MVRFTPYGVIEISREAPQNIPELNDLIKRDLNGRFDCNRMFIEVENAKNTHVVVIFNLVQPVSDQTHARVLICSQTTSIIVNF